MLYRYETDEGRKVVSSAVVKTSAPYLSELGNNVVMQLIEKSSKFKAVCVELVSCQTFNTIIPSQPGKVPDLEERLCPLHVFYLKKKAEFSV